MISRDKERYAELLKAMAAMSGLFSDNDSPYIDSRFVERIYAHTTGGSDIGRADCSFDVSFDSGEGVGIKTFLAGAGDSKLEKVAEFNSLARLGEFKVRDKEELVLRIAAARNRRVLSDSAEFGIDLETSLYHCLVRFPGGGCVHEEPYPIIDLKKLRPTKSNGTKLRSWSELGSGIYFSDGVSQYSFNLSKSVLYKRFSFDRRQEAIDLPIHPNPLELLLGRGRATDSARPGRVIIDRWDDDKVGATLSPGVDYVVLPLYSARNGAVPAASGINQWHAGGRPRKFGEAYVSIPSAIHQLCADFFPPRDTPFSLLLPNSKEVRSAKVCQDGGKALMTDPNFLLGEWLISVIDPSIPTSAFNKPVKDRQPFTYGDLKAIGKDSIRVSRSKEKGTMIYRAEFAPLGSYEDFIDSLT